MACNEQVARDISDPGRVSLLIRVVVHVLLAFCGFLSSILSVTTVRLVKFITCEEGDDGAIPIPTPLVKSASGTHLVNALLLPDGSDGTHELPENGKRARPFLIYSTCDKRINDGGREISYRLQNSISSASSIKHTGFHGNCRAECICGCPLLLLKEGGEELVSPNVSTYEVTTTPKVANVIYAECLCRLCGSKGEVFGGGKTLVCNDVSDGGTEEISSSTTQLRLGDGENGRLLRRRQVFVSDGNEGETLTGLPERRLSGFSEGRLTNTETEALAIGAIDPGLSEREAGICDCLRCSRYGVQSGSGRDVKNGITGVVTDGGVHTRACGGNASGTKKRAKIVLWSGSSPASEIGSPAASSSPASCETNLGGEDFSSSVGLNLQSSPSSNIENPGIDGLDGDANPNWALESNTDSGDKIRRTPRRWGRRRAAAGRIERESGEGARDHSDQTSGTSSEEDADDGNGAVVAVAAICGPGRPLNRRKRGGGHLGLHGGISSEQKEADVGGEEEEEEEEEEEDGGGSGWDGKDLEKGSAALKDLQEALRRERSALAALYEDLEEEREASSVAASEAMAMINRLQEEKAAVQMEARQYQRTAEERQMYDQEALNMLEEILTRRDEEMSALEEEVYSYRTRLISAKVAENLAGDAVTPRKLDMRSSMQMGSVTDIAVMDRQDGAENGISSYSSDRMNNRQQLDEKLVADIREWLRAAKEKGLPAKVEDLVISASLLRVRSSISRKNLLDSFCSVAAEESHRDGVEIEEVDTPGPCTKGFLLHSPPLHRNSADPALAHSLSGCDLGAESGSGYEPIEGRVEQLGQEPSSRDIGVSQDTLRNVDNAEHQSTEQRCSSEEIEGEGEGEEEELKMVLKKRAFKIEENEAKVEEIVAAERQEHPSPKNVETGASHDDDQRTSDLEKRVSVLEYVWKFEEQLHQLGSTNTPPPLMPWKSGVSPVKIPSSLITWKSGPSAAAGHHDSSPGTWRSSVEYTNPSSQSDSSPFFKPKRGKLATPPSLGTSDSDSRSKKSSASDTNNSVRSKLRKLANGAKNVALRSKRDRSSSVTSREVRHPPHEYVGKDPTNSGPKPVSVTGYERADYSFSHSPSRVVLPANPFLDAHTLVQAQSQAQAPREPHIYIPESSTFHRRGLGRADSAEVSLCIAAPASKLVRGEEVFSQQLAHCTEGIRVDEVSLDPGKSQSLDSGLVHGMPSKKDTEEDAAFTEGTNRNRLGQCMLDTVGPGDCEQQGADRDTDGPKEGATPGTLRAQGSGLQRGGRMSSDDDVPRQGGDLKHSVVLHTNRGQEMVEQMPAMESLLRNDSTGAIKDVESIYAKHYAGQSEPSKVAHHLIRGGDPGTCRGDHMVGLSRLLHASPQDQQRKPIERARYMKVVGVS